MLYVRNHPYIPSTNRKIITLRYLPCLSHVWPVCIPHMSHGHSKTLPYLFPLLSFFQSSLSHNNWSKWFCTCALGTLSTRPQAISSSGGPRLGPPFLFSSFCFVLFCFYQFSFYFYINYKFLTTHMFWIGALWGPASV